MYCPNPDCPDRIATGKPGEYRDDVAMCPVCDAALVRGSWEDLAKEPPRGEPATHWDDGGDAGEDVELLRTVDVAEADAVVAALDEARIPFWRRLVGPDGMVLGAGRSATAPGAEHVVLVATQREADARDVIEEMRSTARALEGEAGDALDWGEEEAEEPETPESSGGGVANRLITLVFVILMLLGMAAVLKMVLGS